MIGVMQGRLSSPIGDKIQEFPWGSWEKEFLSAKSLSLRMIEWTLDHHRLHENPIMDQSKSQLIRKLSEENGISIKSITLDCFLEAPIHRSNPLTGFRSRIDDFEAVVKLVSQKGVEIGVLPLVVESGVDDLESLGVLILMLQQLESLCLQNNFRIALECEFNLEQLEWIAAQIETLPHVGFNFDIGNSASLGNNPIDELEIYGTKLFNVHIKDRKYLGKTVPLGLGDAEFEVIEKELKKMNYNGNMILQAARQERGRETETINEYVVFCSKFGWC